VRIPSSQLDGVTSTPHPTPLPLSKGRGERPRIADIKAAATAGQATRALADDFKLIDGKEYKNVTVSRIEPDGIVLRTKSGISKIYFVELPIDVQERFHYNAAIAAAYSAQGARQAGQITGRGQPVEVISHGAQVDINRHLALGNVTVWIFMRIGAARADSWHQAWNNWHGAIRRLRCAKSTSSIGKCQWRGNSTSTQSRRLASTIAEALWLAPLMALISSK